MVARPTVPFEASWSLHPSVLIGTGLLGALYVLGIGPLRRRFDLGPPAPAWRIACFMAGLAVLLVSLNGPIHDLSDYYLFWVHMGQHLLLTLVLPPLLIAGTPGWLLSPLVRRPAVRTVARALTQPVVAALVFTVTLAVWHTTQAYDLMMRNHDVHVLTHRDIAAVASPIHSARMVRFERDADNPARCHALCEGGRVPLAAYLARFDIVVNCVLQDTGAPLMFVTDSDLAAFSPGSLIIDVSCDTGMGFSWARPTSFTDPMFTVGGNIHYYAVDHSPSLLWNSATWEISEALLPHLRPVLAGPKAWDAQHRACPARPSGRTSDRHGQ